MNSFSMVVYEIFFNCEILTELLRIIVVSVNRALTRYIWIVHWPAQSIEKSDNETSAANFIVFT